MQLLLNNNIYTRNKSLENFSNCFDTRIKLNDSNLFEIGKNPNFWNYIINNILLATISEMIKKISSLNNVINLNNENVIENNITPNPDLIKNNISNEINDKNTEKNEFCITLKNLFFKIVNLFNYFFPFNYKELTKFFDSLEKIIFSAEIEIQKAGLECIDYLHNCEKMKNQYFLQTFSIFLINLLSQSLEESIINIEIKDIEYSIANKKEHKLLNKNLSLAFVHFNILNLLDKLLLQNIYFLNEDMLNKLLNCLEASIDISNNFNSNIILRFKITEYNQQIINSFQMKDYNTNSGEELFNLFKQLQIGYKNYFFIAEFLYYKDNGITNQQKYYSKIMNLSVKSIKNYNEKNKEFLNFINKSNNEKEVKEKEAELNNYSISLSDYIFPSIQKIGFYKDKNYRDLLCKLFFDLILCYDERIREKVRDILNVVFDYIYKKQDNK